MATLLVHAPDSTPTSFPLVKPLTSVGPTADCDLHLPEMGRGLIAVQFDGAGFTVTALDGASLLVNGRRRERHDLNDGDSLSLGKVEIVFQSADRIPTPAEVAKTPVAIEDGAALAVRRLAELT